MKSFYKTLGVLVLWSIVSAFVTAGLKGCLGGSPIDRFAESRGGSMVHLPESDGENVYDKVAGALKDQKQELGKDEAKRSLARAATAIGWLSGLLGVLGVIALIAGSMFGGMGRKPAVVAIGVCIAGFWLRYFILAHGYFISEALSWVVIGLLLIVGPLVGGYALYNNWRAKNARGLFVKRVENGESPRDAIGLMPLKQEIKSELDDATKLLQTRAGSLVTAAHTEAEELLKRFKLPVPEVING